MKRHLLIMLSIAVVLSAGLAYLFSHINLIPRPSSLERDSIDRLLRILFTIASIIFALILTAFAYTMVFFRRRRGDVEDGPALKGFAPLEVAWTAIPLAIVIILGVYGAVVMNRMAEPAPSSQSELEVDVLAYRFGWQFTYPEYGVQSFELRLPVDRRVVFHIESKDVVHSFWVPELGPKQDAVPGMTTMLRVTPTKMGRYQVQCSQLCGDAHTYMLATLIVASSGDFEAWINQQKAQSK